MKIYFDTETTGKPRDYKRPMWDVENYPRLVQLGYIVVEGDDIIFENEVIIKPDGYEIPQAASDIHGISTERAMREGISVGDALSEFLSWLEMCDEVIGHNIEFDINVVGAECWRIYSANPFLGKKTICTMRSSTNFCQLPSSFKGGQFKFPTLAELYMKLFGESMGAAHTALQDTQNTVKVYDALVEKGIIK